MLLGCHSIQRGMRYRARGLAALFLGRFFLGRAGATRPSRNAFLYPAFTLSCTLRWNAATAAASEACGVALPLAVVPGCPHCNCRVLPQTQARHQYPPSRSSVSHAAEATYPAFSFSPTFC
eukprot:TRINITY_DN30603_c0_g1_i1.p2 TRINITY_DN30603_c0_g1~~TRINITY_DN30603_c0_g1_i1.p2  ORF type:complete len:121 (-),score=6.64 TRINITY_DN30603_c0_g1_i1:268-630(-)